MTKEERAALKALDNAFYGGEAVRSVTKYTVFEWRTMYHWIVGEAYTLAEAREIVEEKIPRVPAPYDPGHMIYPCVIGALTIFENGAYDWAAHGMTNHKLAHIGHEKPEDTKEGRKMFSEWIQAGAPVREDSTRNRTRAFEG